ncbi:hypothetical protein PCANC_25299 [Puccinia coronata f. sp. avenae]|uniref:Uncharacterized protein n=1 Tax=Puccinia coronata f. sp. avenae TaxID=200324 RepID=A0A2N5RY49_9BASI|nr:hypothetical protein PCANC_25299 [Puccinia coronata f. sp. avenae]
MDNTSNTTLRIKNETLAETSEKMISSRNKQEWQSNSISYPHTCIGSDHHTYIQHFESPSTITRPVAAALIFWLSDVFLNGLEAIHTRIRGRHQARLAGMRHANTPMGGESATTEFASAATELASAATELASAATELASAATELASAAVEARAPLRLDQTCPNWMANLQRQNLLWSTVSNRCPMNPTVGITSSDSVNSLKDNHSYDPTFSRQSKFNCLSGVVSLTIISLNKALRVSHNVCCLASVRLHNSVMV